MLDNVLSTYVVTPVTPAKNQVGRLQAAPLLAVLPVTPVIPQKNGMQAESEKAAAPTDDRHHCRECRHLSNAGYCTAQRFRPVDDIPRRCKDFNGYPDRRPAVQTSALEAPKSPAPNPATFPRTKSEADHNAQGRYFKFLATWPDGSQCYLCQMPRMTTTEMRAQYPTAIKIEPIENEDYPDDY